LYAISKKSKNSWTSIFFTVCSDSYTGCDVSLADRVSSLLFDSIFNEMRNPAILASFWKAAHQMHQDLFAFAQDTHKARSITAAAQRTHQHSPIK
jgi:hypothetical protein